MKKRKGICTNRVEYKFKEKIVGKESICIVDFHYYQ